jgi:hypothetical protein
MSKMEKLGIVLLALLLATLLLVFLSVKDHDEKSVCEMLCNKRDSPIRSYAPGICVCQK